MLGAIVGSILGFAGSILPDAFALLKERCSPPPVVVQCNNPDHHHDDDDDSDDGSAASNPIEPVEECSQNKFLDFLRASVRPVLTYAFFILFVYIKLTALSHAYWIEHTPTVNLLPIIWDDGTEALFSAVLSFWFGSRAMMYVRKKSNV